MAATTGFWKALAKLETYALDEDVSSRPITRPVFIAGLARSGTTILTEIVNQHPAVTSHHYSDFPMTWLPSWWNALRERLPLPQQEPRERAHRDRLMITNDSPEAIEEVLWMHFFGTAHRPDSSHVLDAGQEHPAFEAFYRDHVRKLLNARNRTRYLAKNNYLVTRLEYLIRLFPDARIVIPIREPVQHVASLIKQHRLFCELNVEDPRVARQLQLSGHFEFGPQRCPILVDDERKRHYTGNPDDATWYANQWADIYGYLHERISANPLLAEACMLVRYEDLCSRTAATMEALFAHVDLNDDSAAAIIEAHATSITAPSYYTPDFTAEQLAVIRDVTHATAAQYAYA